MSDALWGAIGAVVGASIVGITTYVSQRQTQLMADCRSAIKDLKRFRQLEDKWAEEISTLKPGSLPEAERKRVRGLLNDKIGQFGEPARIEKLLNRLG
jgi:hypothetical protein